jgi:hypothetical protein
MRKIARRAPPPISTSLSTRSVSPSPLSASTLHGNEDPTSSLIPLIPISLDSSPVSTSSPCLESASLSPGLLFPVTAPSSPLMPMSPISPTIEAFSAFSSPVPAQDEFASAQSSGSAQTQHRSEALAPFIAAIALGAVLCVSVAAWLTWLFRRSKKRPLPPPSNLPPAVAYNDAKYRDRRDSRRPLSKAPERSPSLSMPLEFWSSQKVPLEHDARWSMSVDKKSVQAERNSISEADSISSFVDSESDGASTCLEVQTIDTAHTSIDSHPRRKSITLGGTTFVVETTAPEPLKRRARTQSDPNGSRSNRSSTHKSFGAAMRGLKKGQHPRTGELSSLLLELSPDAISL